MIVMTLVFLLMGFIMFHTFVSKDILTIVYKFRGLV